VRDSLENCLLPFSGLKCEVYINPADGGRKIIRSISIRRRDYKVKQPRTEITKWLIFIHFVVCNKSLHGYHNVLLRPIRLHNGSSYMNYKSLCFLSRSRVL
jgi:hypothetical protein